jgi:hypothetical protein
MIDMTESLLTSRWTILSMNDPLNERSIEWRIHLIDSLLNHSTNNLMDSLRNNYYVPPLNEWSIERTVNLIDYLLNHSTNDLIDSLLNDYYVPPLNERSIERRIHQIVSLPNHSTNDVMNSLRNNYYVPPLNECSPDPPDWLLTQLFNEQCDWFLTERLLRPTTQWTIWWIPYATITTSHHWMNDPLNEGTTERTIHLIDSLLNYSTNDLIDSLLNDYYVPPLNERFDGFLTQQLLRATTEWMIHWMKDLLNERSTWLIPYSIIQRTTW